jgi:hypothetical protein
VLIFLTDDIQCIEEEVKVLPPCGSPISVDSEIIDAICTPAP